MSMSMIQVRGLAKKYGQKFALRDLTFDIPKGQVVGFLGPNGAGKSTAMRILTGYIEPNEGQTLIGGVDVQENPILARQKIGYLPENNPLYEDMFVLEYLEYIADLRQIEKQVRGALIKKAVLQCGLVQVLGQDIGTLSKGFRQRVGLAQAILHDPELLILDEPTSGLDPNQIVEIRALIKELGQEKTVLMSTHILSEAQSSCSRVLIIHEGRLVADDSPENLAAHEGGVVIAIIASPQGNPMDMGRMKHALEGLVGVRNVTVSPVALDTCEWVIQYDKDDPRRAIFEKVVEEKLVLLEMRRKDVSLEEVFQRLTM